MVRLRLQGPIALYTGYSQGFIPLVRELDRRGELDFELTAIRHHVPDGLAEDIRRMLNTRKDYHGLGVLVGFPIYHRLLGTNRRIIYSMYETDDLPFEWKTPVELADEIWVPTTFCRRLFGKYNRKTKVVPWGIEDDVFKRVPVQKDSAVFRFGTVGVMGKRKGIDVLVRAFNKAFHGNPGVSLTIKTRDTKWLPGIANEMIEVVDTDWPVERLVQFYNEVDCVVLPSRGEGIGMVPLQSVMCGTPAITTNWSGPVDYIDNNGVWGINVVGMSLTNSMEAKGTRWAEPDEKHLIELMRWAVDARPVVRGDYSRWTMSNMATEFTEACASAWRRYYGNSH